MALYYPNCFGFLSAVFDGFGGDNSAPQIIPFLPRQATVHLNGYREADTFEIDFDAKLFPFSPDLLKSVAVELFMFETEGLLVNALEQSSTTGTVWNLSQFQTDENRVIAGLADENGLNYGDGGRSFRITGRDYTSLLINREWPEGKRVPVGQDLDRTVQDLVDEAVGKLRNGTTLEVEYIGPESIKTTGVDRGITKRDVVKKPPKVGAHHSRTKKRGFPQRSGKNYWDVIYGLCLQHGKIAYVTGTKVIISDPKTLTADTVDSTYRMAYGRNLKFLKVSRHMGKEAVPQVISSIYDPKTRQRVEIKFPEKTAPGFRDKSQKSAVKGLGGANDVTGSNSLTQNQLRVAPPKGVTDPKVLRDYLEAYYHNLARNEGVLSFETKDLRDLTRSQKAQRGYSLLAMRPGDAVQVAFDAFSDADMRQLSSTAERFARLRELGYSEQVANIVASEYDRINQFQTPFYVKDVSLAWSIKDGLNVAVEGINFIAPQRDSV
jgi:hypothetical protein